MPGVRGGNHAPFSGKAPTMTLTTSQLDDPEIRLIHEIDFAFRLLRHDARDRVLAWANSKSSDLRVKELRAADLEVASWR